MVSSASNAPAIEDTRLHCGHVVFVADERAFRVRWDGGVANRRLTEHGFTARVTVLDSHPPSDIVRCRLHICRYPGCCEQIYRPVLEEPARYHGKVVALLSESEECNLSVWTPKSAICAAIEEIEVERGSVGLLAFLAFAAMRKRLVKAPLGDGIVNLLSEWLPEAIADVDENAGAFAEDNAAYVAPCRVARCGATGSTIVTAADALAGLSMCNHYTPVVARPARARRTPHAPCNGILCGGGRGWPCLSPLQEALAPAGLMPWPVRGDGDCAFHTMAFMDGRECTRPGALLLRKEVAAFLRTKLGDQAWARAAQVLHFVDADDEPALAGPSLADTGQTQDPALAGSLSAKPSPSTSGAVDASAQPALIDPQKRMDSPPAPPPRRSSESPPQLAETNAADPWASEGPIVDSSVSSAVARMLHLSTERDELLIRRLVAMVPADLEVGAGHPPDTQQRGTKRKRAWTPRCSFHTRFRDEVGSAYTKYLQAQGVGPKDRTPKGAASRFWELRTGAPANERIAQFLRRLRRTTVANHEHDNNCRLGPWYAKSAPVKKRARAGGCGRPLLAHSMRADLFKWFCSIRGAVKGRIPRSLFTAQALECRERYLAQCLRSSTPGRAPRITTKWLCQFRTHYNISLRKPNKRWKVSFRVLVERLRIMWGNIYRIRLFILLVFGYDPEIDSIDQKPFHRNEAGSKCQPTLSWTGAREVELNECHGSTRDRFTGLTMCTSSVERAAQIPRLECLFKGGPKIKESLEADLGELRRSGVHGNLEWVSVGTSPSGSYNTDDMVRYLDRHLEEWGPNRQWRILSLDAYAPHNDAAIDYMAWQRGYVVVRVGGGATGVVQVPDTHLHGDLSREYMDREMKDTVYKMQLFGGLPTRTRTDCLHDVILVYNKPCMHVKAARGHWDNMMSNALDGSQDHLGRGSAKELWDKIHMRDYRTQVLADVREAHAAGELTWSYASVQKLIEVFPTRGEMDQYVEGQDDEGELVDVDQGYPWDDAVAQSPDRSDDEDTADGALVEEGAALAVPSPCVQNAAQPLLDEIAALDRLREGASEADVDPRVLRTIEAARKRALKRAAGPQQEDARVAEVIAREQERRDTEMQACRSRAQRQTEEDNRLKAREAQVIRVGLSLREQRAAHRLEAARLARGRQCDDARKTFDAVMFGQGLDQAGGRREAALRHDAFLRVVALAPLPPNLANDLKRDFGFWDRIRRREQSGHVWGSKFLGYMKDALTHIAAGNGVNFHAWWRAQVAAFVPRASGDLVIPGRA